MLDLDPWQTIKVRNPGFYHCIGISFKRPVPRVVDPNRLCSDPYPDAGSHVYSDPDPDPDPAPDPTYIFHTFLKSKV